MVKPNVYSFHPSSWLVDSVEQLAEQSHVRRIFQINRPIKQIQTGIVLKVHDSSLGQKTAKLHITLTDSHSIKQMCLRRMADDD